MEIKKILITGFFLLLTLFSIPSPALATTFDLIAPSGQLTRGQDVQFTINVDTEGNSISSSSIGMTYETQYLQYVSTAPGDTFSTVSADVQGDGKIVFTGSSTNPYSGSGTFAYVTFKLIAVSSGSTELCVLYNPQVSTPTPGPTSTPGPSSTPGPGVPTSPPVPTSLPKTGESKPAVQGIIFASVFFAIAGISLFIFKKT